MDDADTEDAYSFGQTSGLVGGLAAVAMASVPKLALTRPGLLAESLQSRPLREAALEFCRRVGKETMASESALAGVTGATAKQRNAWIAATQQGELGNVRFTFQPKYNPWLKSFGLSEQGVGAQIGKKAFLCQRELVDTMVHEELHHRY